MAKGPQPPGRNRSKSPDEQSKTGSENAKPGQSQEDLLEEVYLAHGKIIKGWAGGSKVGNLLAEYEHLLHLRDPENRNLIHRTIQELQTKKKNAPQEALERIESLVLDDPKLFTAVDDYGKTPMLEAAKHQVTILFRVVNLLIPYSTLEKIKIKCGEDQQTCPLWEVGEIYRKRCLKESKSRQVNGADGTGRRKNIGTSTAEAGSKDDDHPCLHDQVDPDKVIAKNKQLREILEEALKPTDEGQAVFLQSLLAEMRFDPGPKGIGQLISLQSFKLLLELCDDNVFTSIHQNGYSPLQTAVQLYEKQSIDYDLLFQAIQALVDRNPSSIFFKTEDGKAEKTAYRMLKELDDIASKESERSRNLAEELLKRTCIGYRPKPEEENTKLEEEKTGRRFRTSAQREKIKRLEELDMWAKKKDFLYWDAKFEPQLTFKIEKQFYLNLSGESVVLDKSYIETIMEQSGLEFETVLNFVKLPYWKPQSSKPQVDPHDIPVEDDDTDEKEISQNTVQKIDPDPYKAIFEWLWESNVRKIFTVEVDDDGPEPHTNAAIRQSLRGEEPETKPTRDFDVEIWKWKKFDICSETIVTTASNAREIHLYSHGNTAVLRGWACSSGLARLQLLEKLVVNIYPTNLNDERDCERYKEEFRRKIASHSPRLQYKDIGVEIYGYKYGEDGKADKDTKKDSKDGNKLYNPENLPKPIEWIRQLKNFKSFMLNLHLPERNPTVKVAILDDGAKLTNLRGYQKGLSFCAGNEWFVGPCEHGTAMAQCIRAVCPRAELFIARLDDMRQVEDQTFTLVSCYDALKWALDMQVDIISMSWTFLMKGNSGDEYETKFIQLVREAVASRKFILFGALPDKGIATMTNEYAPVGIEGVIKIGSATKYGESSKENVLAKFDFLLPGEDIQTDTGDTVRGSSYATAYAAGLAAMVLYCVKAHRMLNDFSDGDHMAKALDIAKDVDGMKKIFKRLSRTSSDDVAKEGAFIQPYFTFGQDFEEQEEAKKTNLNSIMNAILPIDVLRAFKQ